MESQMLSFQFTAFANIDIETAKLFVRSFDDNYKKSGLPVANVKGAPLFRIDSLYGEGFINISLERIDCFYSSYEMSFVDLFLKQLSKLNSLNALNISRLAINYVELFLDKDFILVDRLNKYFRFEDVLGKSNEIMFRLNNEQSFKQVSINVITTMQSGPMTNNLTFEDSNGIVVHYDINNKPLERIDFGEVDTYIKELYRILINQQSKIMGLLSNE